MQVRKMKITKDSLKREIDTAFPFVEMPLSGKLTIHNENCGECEEVINDIEDYRHKEITIDLLRRIHQELSLLSSEAWRWILPYYLRFGMTSEAQQSEMEIQFLIYNLGPAEQFISDTSKRLSILNRSQLSCLIHFLEWCSTQFPWRDSYEDSIERGIKFLTNLKKNTEV